MGRGGGVTWFVVLFSSFSAFSIFKKVLVIIGVKQNIRNMNSITMLKHIIFYKKGLVIVYKRCLKHLILPLQEIFRFLVPTKYKTKRARKNFDNILGFRSICSFFVWSVYSVHWQNKFILNWNYEIIVHFQKIRTLSQKMPFTFSLFNLNICWGIFCILKWISDTIHRMTDQMGRIQ